MLTVNSDIRPGRYRHFKGGMYQVLGVAKHVDSEEEFVVYQPLYGSHGLVIRAKAEFLDETWCDGKRVPRFVLQSSD